MKKKINWVTAATAIGAIASLLAIITWLGWPNLQSVGGGGSGSQTLTTPSTSSVPTPASASSGGRSALPAQTTPSATQTTPPAQPPSATPAYTQAADPACTVAWGHVNALPGNAPETNAQGDTQVSQELSNDSSMAKSQTISDDIAGLSLDYASMAGQINFDGGGEEGAMQQINTDLAAFKQLCPE
jgi:hypothetical protein